MPDEEKGCTEILNEIISRYSRIAFEKNGENPLPEVGNEPIETEKDFWDWFCGEMKNDKFKQCFLKNEREDFYGSLKVLREEYKTRCK